MEPLSGPISDRLRKLFGRNDPAWNPNTNRSASPRGGSIPNGIEGRSITGRKSKKKKK